MTLSTETEIYDLIAAYAFRASPPSDLTDFKLLASIGGDLGSVTAICFLLYRNLEAPQVSVDRFLFRIAPLLLHQFSRTTLPKRVMMHNRIRGKVDWSNTYRVRFSQGNDPTLFICSQSWRLFDCPENQLFKYLLHQIQTCINQVSPVLKQCYAWGHALRSKGEPLLIGNYLSNLTCQIWRLNSHVYLQSVELPPKIGVRHLSAARASSNKLYCHIADLVELYRSTVESPDWHKWNKLLNQTLPLPPNMEAIGPLLSS